MIVDIVYIKNAILINSEGYFTNAEMQQYLQILRICRLVRISKIYKQIYGSKNDNKKSRRKEDSRVGRKMSDQATKKLIMTTFMLLVCLPLFNSNFYLNPNDSLAGYCYQFAAIYSTPDAFTTTYDFLGTYTVNTTTLDMSILSTDQKVNIDFFMYNVSEREYYDSNLVHLPTSICNIF